MGAEPQETPARPHTGGVVAALMSAALFGISAPLAKLLLPGTQPLPLAGLLYAGAGGGLLIFEQIRGLGGRREAALRRADLGLVAGMVLFGGLLGPVLLLIGLQHVSGVVGALLLNAEAPFTILIAVVFLGEHLGARGVAAGSVVAAGAIALTYGPGEFRGEPIGVLAILGACASWAIDNNLTQRLSLRDPIAIARTKGLCAGSIAIGLSLLLGQPFPSATQATMAVLLGVVSYGISLVLVVHALRQLGAARQATFFATAPFVGAIAAVPLLGESIGIREIVGALLMAIGVGFLLHEQHAHRHQHDALEHDHAHRHDDQHHTHTHDAAVDEPHAHHHRHEPIVHEHPHAPDAHHRHAHVDRRWRKR